MLDFAQAAADATVAAKTAFDPANIGPSAVIAVVTAELIQLAKTSGWRVLAWINVDSTTINRWIGGGAAFLVGLGISFHYDRVTGQLIVNGLLPTALSHGVIQWASQQIYYRLAIDKPGSARADQLKPAQTMPIVPPAVNTVGG